MKSERRHELKTNTLSQGLEGLPDYWREYGNKILLVVIVGLIVFMAVRYWKDKKVRDVQQQNAALDTLRVNMTELDQLQLMQAVGSPGAADARQRVTSAATDAISTLLSTSKDPKILARAYVAQGDLDWKLANMPDPPGAATRPDLKISNREGLLGGAAESYAKVLDPPYNKDALDVFTARMGLAVVAENQAKWDEAKKQYQAIADSKAFPPSFKDIANKRLSELPGYQKAPLLTPPAEPSTAPSAPAVFGPESPMFPTTAPADRPLNLQIPMTLPTTMPAATSAPTTQP
jgi:hypothetical protein